MSIDPRIAAAVNGENGEVRAKVTGRDAFVVPPIDINAVS